MQGDSKMAKIQLYKDSNFGGRMIEVEGDIGNLKDYGFTDEVSSCKVMDGTWLLYKDQDFQGAYAILDKGEYGSPSSMGLSNDSLSSLRPFPQAAENTILLFKDSNYKGRMIPPTGAESNFHNIDANDEVSSIIVLRGTWYLYKDKDFKGERWAVSATGGDEKNGRYPTAKDFENDKISSAQPAR
jgi:hypothetical protein